MTLLVAAACGGDAEEPPRFGLATAEEVQAELDNLGHDIADLEVYLAADTMAPRRAVTGPQKSLERARRARTAAETFAAGGDLESAADSLQAATKHVEEVKRALGVAEEWGVPFEADSP